MLPKPSRTAVVLLGANLALWAYFWTSFFVSSSPYDPLPDGHVPVDLYCVWGRAIGLTESPYRCVFMSMMFWLELPSFALATLLQRIVLANVSADRFLFGISVGGYRLLVTMVVSFFQWHLVDQAVRKVVISRR